MTDTYERMLLCVKAHDTAAATARARAASGRRRLCRLRPERAQRAGHRRDRRRASGRSAASSISAPTTWSPGVVHYGGRGAVVVGEIDGTDNAASSAAPRCSRSSSPTPMLTDNIWGYLWGKMIYGAQLFATALTNEGIADLFAEPRYRPSAPASAHEVALGRAAEGVSAGSFQRLRPGRLPARRSACGDRALLRRYGRLTTAVRPRRIPASGATSPSASAGPRSMPSSARSVEIGRRHGIEMPIAAAPSR